MLDVNSSEFKQQVRNRFFTNTLVTSGIVQVVDQPLTQVCNQYRYQSWCFTQLPSEAENAANRIGEYISRRIGQALISIIEGVTRTEQLPKDDIESNNRRLAWEGQLQSTSKVNDHTIALVPSSLKSQLAKQSSLSYHLCPFTQKRIPSYEGKQLVHDDMCLQPTLFYPGEVKLFFRTPTTEMEVNAGNFTHWWEYDVNVKGFEYVGPDSPTNADTSSPKSWVRTTEKSRILRVG